MTPASRLAEGEARLGRAFWFVRRRGVQERSCGAAKRIDCLPLRSAVLMINPISLVMAFEQACLHEFRRNTTEIALADRADLLPDLFGDKLILLLGIKGEGA